MTLKVCTIYYEKEGTETVLEGKKVMFFIFLLNLHFLAWKLSLKKRCGQLSFEFAAYAQH